MGDPRARQKKNLPCARIGRGNAHLDGNETFGDIARVRLARPDLLELKIDRDIYGSRLGSDDVFVEAENQSAYSDEGGNDDPNGDEFGAGQPSYHS